MHKTYTFMQIHAIILPFEIRNRDFGISVYSQK